MLLFGFSAGLPYLLVFTTLTAWLRTEGVSRTAIGLFSWIGITYSIKFLWAPFVDKLRLPVIGARLGQRRSWMLLAQLGLAASLAGMAWVDPTTELGRLAVLALLAAFASATQDITIDAFRIESEPDEYQAAMASTYVLGYRVATLVAGAGALYLADYFDWRVAYLCMAAATGVGMLAVAISAEPDHRDRLTDFRRDPWVIRLLGEAPGGAWRDLRVWLTGAVLAPLLAFLQRYRLYSIAILALVGLYKMSDISMAAMANPLYVDLGFSLSEIASVTKVFGLAMTVIGGLVAGVLVARFGIPAMLLLGAVLVALTNLLFAWLATVGYSIAALFVTIGGDNFSNGFAAVTLVAWLSSLVDKRYTATQYALLSSLMTLPGMFVGGFSGLVADHFGYVLFFFYAASLGLPAVLLCSYFLALRVRGVAY
ncbi:MAG: MFS transporter [Xanthomonadales bacterium]|nr:MFS transporter [Xanthomonadales bacterium]NIN60324.1 MFS transporter [Xanthomonadales bacterium]NIN75676.1 MFS transporter [Xanthomonadales bacterium]NIO14749.1 MFS transporter [Xanthomonadales bacterium]NIP12717.1 MFS transporter [Xanthomonadales bacterium]